MQAMLLIRFIASTLKTNYIRTTLDKIIISVYLYQPIEYVITIKLLHVLCHESPATEKAKNGAAFSSLLGK